MPGRIALEVLVWIAGFALLTTLSRGLAPVAPAVAGALRAMLNPFFLAVVFGAFVLWRLGRGGRRTARPGSDRES